MCRSAGNHQGIVTEFHIVCRVVALSSFVPVSVVIKSLVESVALALKFMNLVFRFVIELVLVSK